MKFTETKLKGAFIVNLEEVQDERGSFVRLWCEREFAAHGLDTRVRQCSISLNKKKGTLRGMHYQTAPYEEIKLVRCVRGSIFDVIIDLRPKSPSFTRHFSAYLTQQNRKMIYIPAGCAHGFQAMEDDTEVHYQISEFYVPEAARGVRWNDPIFAIRWPDVGQRIVSQRDCEYPDFVIED